MTRQHLLALLITLALGAAQAADQFVPPPPLPAPPPYPTAGNPYQEQVWPDPPVPQGGVPARAGRPAGSANRPYLAFGVKYPNPTPLPGLELSAGIDNLLGLDLLGVRADFHATNLTRYTARLNALLELPGPANLYLAGGPRWGHLDLGGEAYHGTFYGAAAGARAELGRVQFQLELRLDTPIERLTFQPVAQLSLLYFP